MKRAHLLTVLYPLRPGIQTSQDDLLCEHLIPPLFHFCSVASDQIDRIHDCSAVALTMLAVERRKLLHSRFFLPSDRPLLRLVNALFQSSEEIDDSRQSEHLRNVHTMINLPPSGDASLLFFFFFCLSIFFPTAFFCFFRVLISAFSILSSTASRF
jgi:hypothetical protein